ncbi:hypothetical protein [Pseudomonas nitroreducens]|uniref:hypothetical protein n=1 Tax=Pseudomonas nitroreducens TaxID=46680 RepID=UPI002FDFE96C
MARYVSAAAYEVRKPDGTVVARIIRGVYLQADPTHQGGFDPYYAGTVITDDKGERLVHMRLGPPLGVIEGRTLITQAGERWELVELPWLGSRVQDADLFRVMLLQREQAIEDGDEQRAAWLGVRIESAAWMVCPDCGDRFGEREDCPTCQGQGIVPDP